MEDLNQPLDAGLGGDAPDQGLKITDEVRMYWRESAKWALFFSILFFIVIGLILVAAFFGGLVSASSGGSEGIFVVIIFIFYASIVYFPAWYYYKYATLSKLALNQGDNNALEDAFDYLKRFYRFIGYLIIVIMALYILFLIFGIAMLGSMRNGF